MCNVLLYIGRLAFFLSQELDIGGRFNQMLNNFNKTSGKPCEIAGSMGIITTEPGERPSSEELLKRIDNLMYNEKRRRKAGKK